jgi:anti-anti-sigma factor
MNDLEIHKEERENNTLLKCKGRLDANHSAFLNDTIEKTIREGKYHLYLDLSQVEYLSSAGIRILVNQYKNLKKLNGFLQISQLSTNVKQVLEMVGMASLFSLIKEDYHQISILKEDPGVVQSKGFIFKPQKLNPIIDASFECFGDPTKIIDTSYKAEHSRNVATSANHFAIGLGAIGETYDECKNRFGEYLIAGKNAVYLSSDGSKKPDYMISTGNLIASVNELYGMHFEGEFSYFVPFEPTNSSSITLSSIVETLEEITSYKKWIVVMFAESAGLIGTSLNMPPTTGKKLFAYPEIKETFNFTIEPVHNKLHTLSVGFFESNTQGDISPFLRPIQPDSKIMGHMHTVVFPFLPVKKNEINLSQIIGYFFDTLEPIDLIHLINDSREINGIGESRFINGYCWLSPIK